MVDISLLEVIGLCSSFILLLGTVRCIVPLVVAFEAEHLRDVPPGFSIWMRVSIVVVMDDMSILLVPRVSRMIPMGSTIVVVAMGSVAAFPMVIMSTMVRVSSVMIVYAVMTMMVMGGMLLERGFRMMLVDSKLPLSVLSLLQTIIQDDSLVQQFLIVGSVSNGQRNPKFII